MPYSYTLTVASGLTPAVPVAFGYLDKSHVHVSLDGVQVDDLTLLWANDALINLPATPIVGTVVKVYRITPGADIISTYGEPAAFAGRDLNRSFRQILYMSQEALDGSALAVTADFLDILSQVTALAGEADSDAGLAAASASALGNQVHQYDTRALALAATIPVGVKNLIVLREDVGYPLSRAPYIPGTSSGPRAFQEAAGHWWELDLTGGSIDPRWYGAKAVAGHDDTSYLNAAETAAKALGKSLTYFDGWYEFSTTRNLAGWNFHIIAMGTNVTLKHTGAGRAVSFDGTAVSGAQALNQTFGGRNPFYIKGNASTTDLLFIDTVHHARFYADLRDTAGAGCRANFGVCNRYDIKCSRQNVAGTGFAVVPTSGFIGTQLFDCDINVIIEGCGTGGNFGFSILSSSSNRITGTVESCLAGGIHEASSCSKNVYNGVDCEVNGAAYDWFLEGSNATLIGCVGANTPILTAQIVTGNRTTLLGCTFDSFSNAGVDTKMDGCEFTGAFSDTGTGTTILRCSGVSDNRLRVLPVTGAPTFSAAKGTLASRSDGSSSSTRLYINTNGSTGWTPVTTAT